MKRYLTETQILDFSHPELISLIDRKGWKLLDETEKTKQIYNFCKDEIPFGYNADTDDMPASSILKEGIGHCNSKSTLLMALLRAVGVPCRIHGFTIYKSLQKGAMGTIPYFLAPSEILHSWVEVYVNGKWIDLEGIILDNAYLCQIQSKFKDVNGPFCGYAIATDNLKNPGVDWNGGSTYIQKQGIARDFGVFDSPDAFYASQGTNVKGIKKFLYKTIAHRLMNASVRKIRNSQPGNNITIASAKEI